MKFLLLPKECILMRGKQREVQRGQTKRRCDQEDIITIFIDRDEKYRKVKKGLFSWNGRGYFK
jgi:hypothetical protein